MLCDAAHLYAYSIYQSNKTLSFKFESSELKMVNTDERQPFNDWVNFVKQNRGQYGSAYDV